MKVCIAPQISAENICCLELGHYIDAHFQTFSHYLGMICTISIYIYIYIYISISISIYLYLYLYLYISDIYIYIYLFKKLPVSHRTATQATAIWEKHAREERDARIKAGWRCDQIMSDQWRFPKSRHPKSSWMTRMMTQILKPMVTTGDPHDLRPPKKIIGFSSISTPPMALPV